MTTFEPTRVGPREQNPLSCDELRTDLPTGK